MSLGHDAASTIVRLVDAGYGGQLLVSGDLGVRCRLHAYGGWGYDHVLRHVVPLLQARGLDDPGIDALLARNPARVLIIDIR